MLRITSLVVTFGISLSMVGCKSSTQVPKPKNKPYGKIELGMPFHDAKALVVGDGEKREHDALPVVPKPRDIYKKLPADTEWRVWTAGDESTLILGIAVGKVAFKQVNWIDGSERKGDITALPEYQ